MKNPLNRRFLRELKEELGKYIVIFTLLLLSIGFTSGFLVADGSMVTAYEQSFEKYQVEYGNFRSEKKLNRSQRETIEEAGVTLYDNTYTQKKMENGAALRIFQNRTQVNLVCLMEGDFPEAADEIAIDRMHAVNNGLSVGDTLTSADGSRTWTITGLVALPDYSALFENNSDAMFDAVQFGTAIASAEGFAEFDQDELVWSYSWLYSDPPADEAQEQDMAEDLMKVINGACGLESYIPRYANQAIQYTGNDMGQDKGMMIVLLYIMIGIMAFVFAITIRNTIRKEANVIGTMRAMGYTRGELVRHYMTMPLLVTAAGALLGNILGYTFFKDVCVDMYYGSYSLPTYVTIWNAEAFLLTTVVPLILMAAITWIMLRRMLSLSPLKFIRRDLSRRRQKRVFPLPAALRFFSRFRLRVIFQNLGSYAVLFFGIFFANLMLMFGMALPAILDNYQAEIGENVLANYQYILQVPYDALDEKHKLSSLMAMLEFEMEVQTDNADAESFTAYTLKYTDNPYQQEDITLYGVQEDSRYITADMGEGAVYVSSAFADKYSLSEGDIITLKEPYEDDTYTFTVTGIYDYAGGLTVFMGQAELNQVLGLAEEYFSGYLSDTPITDIDSACIGTVIDLDALTKISRQLDVSMGEMMGMVDGFSIVIYLVLMYLLTKMIIEKNAQSISMCKILGYSNREISGLYLHSTTLVVMIILVVSLPLSLQALLGFYRMMFLYSMSGWLPVNIPAAIYGEMILMGIASYGAVALLEYRKLRRVSMEEALKNVE